MQRDRMWPAKSKIGLLLREIIYLLSEKKKATHPLSTL